VTLNLIDMKTTIRVRQAILALFVLAVAVSSFAQDGFPPPPPPPIFPGTILDAWELSDSNFLSYFRYAPVLVTNAGLAESWNEYSLQIDITNAAWLTYAVVEPDGKTNLDFLRGSVSLWFAPDWGSGNGIGNWGTLLEAGTWDVDLLTASGAWGLYISPNGSTIYFSVQTNGFGANLLSAPISWNSGEWHAVDLTYTSTNSALYLDGVLAATGSGVAVSPGTNATTFSIGSDGNAGGTGLLQARGAFADLATYNYPLGADAISNNYVLNSEFVYPLPSSGGFSADFSGPPPIPGGGTPEGGSGGGGSGYTPPTYPTNGFWLELLALGTNAYNTNPLATTIIVHGTENDATNEPIYQLWFTTNLAPPIAWMVEQTFLGMTNTNFTVLTVLMSNRPTLFFEAVNLGIDPTDSGLPVWYLLQNGLDPTSFYTGTNLVSNPYLQPAGDGWTYQALFNSGMSPNVLHAPPAPSGFTVKLMTNGLVQASWPPAPDCPANGAGAVTGYTISVDNYWNSTFGRNVTSCSFNAASNWTEIYTSTTDPSDISVTPGNCYALQVNYANTNSLWTDCATAQNNECPITAAFVRGSGGKINMAVSAIPSGVNAIRVFGWTDWTGGVSQYYGTNDLYEPPDFFFDVPTNAFANGIYILSDSQAPLYCDYQFLACALANDGSLGPVSPAYFPWSTMANIPFIDGTLQLHQNVSFLLQSALTDNSVNYGPQAPYGSVFDTYGETNYAYSGFHYDLTWPDQDWPLVLGNDVLLDEFRPFEDNSFFTNYVYRPGALNPDGSLASGAYTPNEEVLNLMNCPNNPESVAFDAYDYVLAGNTNPPAPALTNWQGCVVPSEPSYSVFLWELGMYSSGDHLGMSNGVPNLFGLDFQSAVVAYGSSNGVVVKNCLAGSYITNTQSQYSLQIYPATAAPVLQTVGFYFARPDFSQVGPPTTDPLPGNPSFMTTNTTSPLMIATVGQSFAISAWAKQAILNGSNTNAFGYLEQYFDKAYLADTNGNPTTTQTGILSEYGEFFPTEPGTVFLTTRSNAYSPPGTNTIQVIGLFTDANHDGTIDTRFSGPDFTSPTRPFRFWVNDDNDSGDTGGDDIPGEPAADGKIPNGASGQINGTRDLVDFFPVFVDIQNVLLATPTNERGNYQFVLSQADGAINFAYATTTTLSTNNPLHYLTDTNTAFSLSNAPVTQITSNGVPLSYAFLSQLSVSGQNVLVPSGSGIILCEASAPTSNPLVLSVLDANSNVLAQANLYLNVTGVEQMFRHKNLTRATYPNRPDGPPDRLTDSDVPNEPDTTDKNFVFVHGYNVNASDARGWEAEIFKRMYWSGSHAKFYGVTWFAYDGQCSAGPIRFTPNLQTNIVHAFETAPQLSAFLNGLSGTNVLAAHSLGNMTVLSALNDCGNTNISAFFMMDAAFAIEAIDGSAGVNTNMIHPDWAEYTNTLWASYWHQLFTNDYRTSLTWNNRLANFQTAEVYNFYSSGEEVLRMYPGMPPNAAIATAEQIGFAAQGQGAFAAFVIHSLWPDLSGKPVGDFTWVWQEKMKGRCDHDFLLGSSHNGWGFNNADPSYSWYTNDPEEGGLVLVRLSPPLAAALPASQLQTNAFFDMSAFTTLFGSGGSAYAQTYSNSIISSGIPALTLPVGANVVNILGAANNFNMQTSFENAWPLERMQTSETNNWHHSDMHEVAYTYTYKLFQQMVTTGNLK
jgi:hypothetical protein